LNPDAALLLETNPENSESLSHCLSETIKNYSSFLKASYQEESSWKKLANEMTDQYAQHTATIKRFEENLPCSMSSADMIRDVINQRNEYIEMWKQLEATNWSKMHANVKACLESKFTKLTPLNDQTRGMRHAGFNWEEMADMACISLRELCQKPVISLPISPNVALQMQSNIKRKIEESQAELKMIEEYMKTIPTSSNSCKVYPEICQNDLDNFSNLFVSFKTISPTEIQTRDSSDLLPFLEPIVHCTLQHDQSQPLKSANINSERILTANAMLNEQFIEDLEVNLFPRVEFPRTIPKSDDYQNEASSSCFKAKNHSERAKRSQYGDNSNSSAESTAIQRQITLPKAKKLKIAKEYIARVSADITAEIQNECKATSFMSSSTTKSTIIAEDSINVLSEKAFVPGKELPRTPPLASTSKRHCLSSSKSMPLSSHNLANLEVGLLEEDDDPLDNFDFYYKDQEILMDIKPPLFDLR
jgi:hypothetical protein